MSNAKSTMGLASRMPYEDEKSLIAKDLPIINSNQRTHNTNTKSNILFKLSILIFLACGISVIALSRSFFQNANREEEDSTPEFFQLVKKSVATPTPTPSATAAAVLENFMVYQPVLTPSGATDETTNSNGLEVTEVIGDASTKATSCSLLLMEYSFGYSYGVPFVANYVPPACKFNRVTMNFTVTSRGRQFDRLAIMYFNSTEVWRTSTSEPTTAGIRWEYHKDMTEYLSLWETPQKLIFDLGNIIDSTYTGFFNTTLTATFFTSDDTTIVPADLIVPISARNGAASASSMFVLPADIAANNVTLPRNINRAVFSVSACGQATEEFWWSNVPQSTIDSFEPYDGTLYGYSPFREVQVLIDGQLAGVQWPFPVIFTGGVVPGLWRPIAGIDAYDLREHEIDITPFLPLLCDGKSHSFEIRVAGIDDNGSKGTLVSTVGSSWYVTGKIFLWLDTDAKSITTGTTPTFSFPAPSISVSQSFTQDSTGVNETLTYTTNVKRSLSISSKIKTQSGSKTVTWSQNLGVTNYGLYTDYGAVQLNEQNTVGTDVSTGGTAYSASYKYPLYANTSYIVQADGNFTIGAEIVRGLDLDITGTPVFPTGLQPFGALSRSAALVKTFSGTALSTTQNGSATYYGYPTLGTATSFGTTSQDFTFSGIGGNAAELYYRSVEAVNSTVTRDVETLVGVSIGNYGSGGKNVGGGQKTVGVVSPKQALGRGPGQAKQALVQAGAGA